MSTMMPACEAAQFPIAVRLKTGITTTIRSKCDYVIWKDIFEDCEYRSAIDHVLGSTTGSVSLLDLGMNIGYFTLYAMSRMHEAQRQFQIVGIEAVKELTETASEQIRTQPGAENVRIIQGLIGNRDGHWGLRISGSHPCNALVRGYSDTSRDTKEVRFMRFMDLMSLNLPERIDLMKCDIEGAEEFFLESYPELLRRTASLVIELHHDRCHTGKCMEILDRASFIPKQTIRQEESQSTVLYVRSVN